MDLPSDVGAILFYLIALALITYALDKCYEAGFYNATEVETIKDSRDSAEFGSYSAMYYLADMYSTGQGLGDPLAHVEKEGVGPEIALLAKKVREDEERKVFIFKDPVEAHKWFSLAAAQIRARPDLYDFPDQHCLKRAALLGLPPAQLAEAQRLATEWQAAFDARQ
jgi:hypothetical protein